MPPKVRKIWIESDFWQNNSADDVLRRLTALDDIMERNHAGATPLHMATMWGNVEIVRAVLEIGASVHSLDNRGKNPLYYAVHKGDVGVVRALLEAGADPNDPKSVRIAAKLGDAEVMQALLEAGADTELRINEKGMTPLHFAAVWGNDGCVQALLEAGADTNAKDAYGLIPQMYAKERTRTFLETELGDLHKAAEDRNIMLYWDDSCPPEVCAVVEKWRDVCPGWNVSLFDESTACQFLQARYGKEIVRLFLRCAVPAMKSDFFRVFWAMSEGGIYSDVQYVPKREPLFFDPDKDITVYTYPRSGPIINDIFYSRKGSKELKLVALEILESISRETIPFVDLATGPAAWCRALGKEETGTMAVISRNTLHRFVRITEHLNDKMKSTSEMHWIKLQKRMSIYATLSKTGTFAEIRSAEMEN